MVSVGSSNRAKAVYVSDKAKTSQLITMLEINTYKDLEDLINNQIEESLHLDYKASDSLGKSDGRKKEIGKDVSSFANSDGGIIIYGVKEFVEENKKHLPEKIDSIDRNEFSKEWLEQIINSNIFPRINDLKIIVINVPNQENRVVYVVQIKKSSTAHQASDLRYYRRYNFLSTAMFDYEIRDILNRNKTPRIKITFEIEQYTFEVKPFAPKITLGSLKPEKEFHTSNTLKIYAFNEGGIYADYVNCFLEIPDSILDDKEYDHLESYKREGITYKKIYRENTIREVREVTTLMNNVYPKYWPSRYDPILPDTRFRLEEIRLKSNVKIEDGILYWKVNADNAEAINGEISVKEIFKSVKVLDK